MKVKILLFWLVICISLFLISSIQAEGSALKNQELKRQQDLSSQSIQVQSINHPKGDYFIEEAIPLKIKLLNTTDKMVNVVVIWQLQDDNKLQVGSITKQIQLDGIKSEEVQLLWQIPKTTSSGMYTSKVQVFIPPITFDAVPLILKMDKSVPVTGQFGVFRQQDNFSTFDSKFWKKSTHQLGMSLLNPDNISIENEMLKISLVPNCFEGGEIQSLDVMSYGMYEAKLKLPSAPSSITGFFLYTSPDYYYEIDIEIQNDSRGIYYLTTYANGKVSNSYEGKLGFDPTSGFHTYRIVYGKGSVSFYIDEKSVKKWTKNLPDKSMHLMLNTWYPTWLKGTSAPANTELIADWIRY